jgi:lysozyme
MDLNQKGIDLVKKFEGCQLKAYPDPGSGNEPWTIGYGHTGGIKKGMTITQAQADAFLHSDLQSTAKLVKSALTCTLNDNQFSALVSFTFNLGIGNLKSSTLLKKVNSGAFSEASSEFLKWNKAGGRVLAGLTKRRQAEADLFMENV